ncbi:MAG TPA: RsmB/NOP family class I SAM-dependent RNA methyltransferase, partial [archaeon]|nr:RsmB/NOP family class I SAM-dependent RNA methyltransferase [archaeon]
RLEKLGLNESIYQHRSKKCILSREPLALEKIPWYDHAYFIPENFSAKGKFIFDPVSIVPCLALAPKKSDRILDMCAAPGTKTFILSFLTNNEAHITANDINKFRVRRLRFNVEKFSLSVDVTNMSGRKIEGTFDKILLDAPCTGEGMVNKKEKLFANWSENSVRFLSRKQKKLITHAFKLLAPGGTLVYSTCTFEPDENEAVVDFLLRKSDAVIESVDVNIRHADGITEWNKPLDKRLSACMRIYPQHNGTGGFFVAKIRKLL